LARPHRRATLATTVRKNRRLVKQLIGPDLGKFRLSRIATQRIDVYDPEYGTLLRILTATGARRGEVCGLRWSDLDRGSRTLSIHRSVASVSVGTIVKDTKSHAARRRV
jgi:integrase